MKVIVSYQAHKRCTIHTRDIQASSIPNPLSPYYLMKTKIKHSVRSFICCKNGLKLFFFFYQESLEDRSDQWPTEHRDFCGQKSSRTFSWTAVTIRASVAKRGLLSFSLFFFFFFPIHYLQMPFRSWFTVSFDCLHSNLN